MCFLSNPRWQSYHVTYNAKIELIQSIYPWNLHKKLGKDWGKFSKVEKLEQPNFSMM